MRFQPWSTDDDFRRYLKFRPQFSPSSILSTANVAHFRRGDFHANPLIHPVLSRETLDNGIKSHGLDPGSFCVITEENPHVNDTHPAKLRFLQDFLLMCAAANLFVYPRSSFSMCAARFNANKVYLPCDWKNGPTECRWELRKETR